MLRNILFFPVLFSVFCSCSQTPNKSSDSLGSSASESIQKSNVLLKEINPNGMTIKTRYTVPNGFERVQENPGSFGHYLRSLPLKPVDSEVLYYNGNTKPQGSVYRSVVDLPIGTRNLHQCADAVMRFRGEYLWSTRQSDQIHFNFTNGFQVDYSKWLAGNKMVVSGNNTYWKPGPPRMNTYGTFWDYMELIFNYAGTLSLERELSPREFKNLQIGDVLIQGGSPGHAVIIVDVCENKNTGEKRFLLAQSYMPAQETQILINPTIPETSWYSADTPGEINTPEWRFQKNNLMYFQ